MIAVTSPIRRVRGGLSHGAMYRWEIDYTDDGAPRTMAFETETLARRFVLDHPTIPTTTEDPDAPR